MDIGGTDNGKSLRRIAGSGAVLLGGQTLTLTNVQDRFAGVIGGWGGLTGAGGHEVLSGGNTFTGMTTVEEWSSLSLSGSGSIAASKGLLNIL